MKTILSHHQQNQRWQHLTSIVSYAWHNQPLISGTCRGQWQHGVDWGRCPSPHFAGKKQQELAKKKEMMETGTRRLQSDSEGSETDSEADQACCKGAEVRRKAMREAMLGQKRKNSKARTVQPKRAQVRPTATNLEILPSMRYRLLTPWMPGMLQLKIAWFLLHVKMRKLLLLQAQAGLKSSGRSCWRPSKEAKTGAPARSQRCQNPVGILAESVKIFGINSAESQ